MNRTDRLLALILHLQSRRFATAASMAEHFGLSPRTIYRDMKALSEAGVPVLAEAGVGYWLMRGYLLPPVNFTEEEACALATGAMLLSRAGGTGLSGQGASALNKVRAVLPPARREELARLERGLGSLAASPQPDAKADLAVIQKALAGRRTLRLLYQAQGAAVPSERVVEPLGLLHYLDRWHLIAWCRLRGGLRDFRTDRMTAAQALAERFPPRPGFDLAAYVREHMPEPRLTARVRFAACAADRALRQWWMGIRERRETPDGGAELTLAALDLVHLASWLLSFGRDATVLDPPELRRILVELAQAAVVHHRAEN